MPLKILPKKRWHVATRANIERVRQDEEKARLEEEEKARRVALADQEARTALLRSRARKGKEEDAVVDNSSCDSAVVVAPDKPQHLNFFQEIEDGLKQGSNAEYEAEKRADKEKQEKAIGLLTYLGQSASEKHSEKPWYLKPGSKRARSSSAKKEDDDEARDSKRKGVLDPLKSMTKYLEEKKKSDSHKSDRHSKDKHHKHKKHKKDKHDGHDSKSKRSSNKKSIEELRAERLKREQTERARERDLLADRRGEKKKPQTPLEDDPYRYNSQFNPDLVRRHARHHQRHQPF